MDNNNQRADSNTTGAKGWVWGWISWNCDRRHVIVVSGLSLNVPLQTRFFSYCTDINHMRYDSSTRTQGSYKHESCVHESRVDPYIKLGAHARTHGSPSRRLKFWRGKAGAHIEGHWTWWQIIHDQHVWDGSILSGSSHRRGDSPVLPNEWKAQGHEPVHFCRVGLRYAMYLVSWPLNRI